MSTHRTEFTCQTCKKLDTYVTSQKHSRPTTGKFCTRACMTAFHRYPFSREQLLREYQEGRSQILLAKEHHLPVSTIHYVMKIWHIPKRKGIPWQSRVFGEKSHRWKGDQVTQETFHQRVRTIYGKPKECSSCGTTDKRKVYDWANINGDYTNRLNFRRMCRSCHRLFDQKRGLHPTKLTEQSVLQIRQDYATRKWTQSQLAKTYGVDQSAISNAISGRNWGHVKGNAPASQSS